MRRLNIKKQTLTQGISLIELLIAMSLSVVILNATIRVYAANKSASTLIAGISSQQGSSRIALNQLNDSLKLVGHYGGVDPEEMTVDVGVNIVGVGDCNHAWLIGNFTQPLVAHQGGANSPLNCIPDDQYVPDSDVLILRYASPVGATASASVSADRIYLRTSPDTGGEILLGSAIDPDIAPAQNVGTYNYTFETEIYFLRPCSELNGSNCDDGIPTLVRYKIQNSELEVEPLAEGVEQFQIEFGEDRVDENGDPGTDDVADFYTTANNIVDWQNVVSARYNIIVRSELRDKEIPDTQTYNMAGGFEYTPIESNQYHRRKMYTKVVQLRNMSRG